MTSSNLTLGLATLYNASYSPGLTDLAYPAHTGNTSYSWSFTPVSSRMTATAPNQAPVVVFEVIDSVITSNQSATFDASRTMVSSAEPAVYIWDFGDGNQTKTNKPILSHAFASAGKYLVLLKVSDGFTEVTQPMEVLVRPLKQALAQGSSMEQHLIGAGILLGMLGTIGIAIAARYQPWRPVGRRPAGMETVEEHHVFVFDAQRCVGCGLCSRRFPNTAVAMVEKKPVHDASKCSHCRQCEEACPKGSIRIAPEPFLKGNRNGLGGFS